MCLGHIYVVAVALVTKVFSLLRIYVTSFLSVLCLNNLSNFDELNQSVHEHMKENPSRASASGPAGVPSEAA